MIKVFGIGNILLCDDAIGVRVLETLISQIHTLAPTIEAIIGETDYLFCLDCISTDDFVIIIDSTYLNIKPGTITYFPFLECDRFINFSQSAHDINLLKILRLDYPEIQGGVIGIEAGHIDFSLELSEELQKNFKNICKEVLQLLRSITSNLL